MSLMPMAQADSYLDPVPEIAQKFVVKQATQGLTVLSGNLAQNDIKSTDSTMFGWTREDFDPAGNESAWSAFNANTGKLEYVELVESGYVTYPRVSTATVIITEQGGRVLLNTDGTFVYTAPPGYAGPDSFTYAMVDQQFDKSVATVTLFVEHTEGANLRPVAANDDWTIAPSEIFTGNVLANDTDGADGIAADDTLTVVASTFLTAKGGLVSMKADGTFTYTPKAGFTGTDSFDYVVRDGYMYVGLDASIRSQDVGTVTLTIADAPVQEIPPAQEPPAEQPPVVEQTVVDTTPVEQPPVVDVLPVDEPAPVQDAPTEEPPAQDPPVPVDELPPAEEPQPVEEALPVEQPAVPLNIAPVAVDDEIAGRHDRHITGNVLQIGIDIDSDGDALSVVPQLLMLTAAGGLVTITADGSFTYTPPNGFTGNDAFDYVVTDGLGGFDTGTVSLAVTNAGPNAVGENFEVPYGEMLTGNLLTNDSDPDGDELTVVEGQFETAHGTVEIYANGEFNYLAHDGYHGTDSLQYTVVDSAGAHAIAVLQITVAPPVGYIGGTDGNDVLTGTLQDDRIASKAGDDIAYGREGNDSAEGGEGADKLFGEQGNDRLAGNAGKDTLAGGDGDDVLDGGTGGDVMTGGRGADTFIVNRSGGIEGDRIRDFRSEDQIAVKAAEFGIGAGKLPDQSYLAKTGAADVDHGRFVYNANSQTLFWDADGKASTADEFVAVFGSKVQLSWLDFEAIA